MKKNTLKILLAVDGSKQAEDAARYVGGLLPPGRVELTLFHVAGKIPEFYWDMERFPGHNDRISAYHAWAVQHREEASAFMERSRAAAVSRGIPENLVTVKIEERKVGIARDIAFESQGGYDAVVVGRTGTSRIKDLLLGSVANKLLGRLASVPLWLVGGAPENRKALMAVDNSENAMNAVEYAGAVLAGTNAQVMLLHVRRNPMIFHTKEEEDYAAVYDRESERIKGEMDSVIEEATRRLLKAGMTRDSISGRVRADVESRGGAIFEEAVRGGFDTIVVGRRGLSRVEEFFMGRVSHKVIQLAREKAVWVVG